jgi:hypothetical protein
LIDRQREKADHSATISVYDPGESERHLLLTAEQGCREPTRGVDWCTFSTHSTIVQWELRKLVNDVSPFEQSAGGFVSAIMKP